MGITKPIKQITAVAVHTHMHTHMPTFAEAVSQGARAGTEALKDTDGHTDGTQGRSSERRLWVDRCSRMKRGLRER